MPSISHSERTVSVYRSPEIHEATLKAAHQTNPTVRTFVLSSTSPIYFLPGQWLDVHVQGLSKPGGFTITSSPSLATRPADPPSEEGKQKIDFEIHLAIQKALDNPVTEYFWQTPLSKIVGTFLSVRVGGTFTWPPSGEAPARAVFLAGGVGINPLMSMVRFISELPDLERPKQVEFLYGFKIPSCGSGSECNGVRIVRADEVLFLPELLSIKNKWDGTTSKMGLRMFATGDFDTLTLGEDLQHASKGRMTEVDVITALGSKPGEAVAYVCGPSSMTDRLVQVIKDAGVVENRVLCERWW
jgi:ferredoxin-NADP reductase